MDIPYDTSTRCVSIYAIIHPTVKVYSFTTIEHGVTIDKDAVVGSNCYIGRNANIGEGTRIQHGVFICRSASIGKNVFIGPLVVLTDDRYPRVSKANYIPRPPVLEEGCSIGAGAVILPGVRIGRGAMVGAGAVVAHDVLAETTVKGVPATPSMKIEPQTYLTDTMKYDIAATLPEPIKVKVKPISHLVLNEGTADLVKPIDVNDWGFHE